MAVNWQAVSPWPTRVPQAAFLKELEGLDLDDACEVYRIRHRSIFKTSVPPLGEVAVKEVRHLRLIQRFKLRHGGRSKPEREFRNAHALYEKGLRTPAPYAIGLDRDWSGLRRVFQIYEWLPGAETLTECVKRHNSPWDEVSDFLWSCAQAGLVHREHSSDNLLRCEAKWYVVDLANAIISQGYQRAGFVRDVARVARKLLREKVLEEGEIEDFLDAIAARAHDQTMRGDIRAAMAGLVEEGRRKMQRSS